MPDPPEKPARRRRYQGSHPRTFHEKYKELNPARYTDEARKILAAGKTPAGTHRPIMVEEILEVLATDPDVDLDVRAWSLRSGNQLLSLEREGPMFLIRVRRA